jgi:hypothetical protein
VKLQQENSKIGKTAPKAVQGEGRKCEDSERNGKLVGKSEAAVGKRDIGKNVSNRRKMRRLERM